jgi:AhpD family alkylhydroperoxidase
MPRVPAHDLDTAPADSRPALRELQAHFGKVLNIFGEMAHSPPLLNAFVAFESALAEHGTLTESDKQAVRLAVSGYHDCRYCQSAYTLAAKAAGLTEEQTVELRGGTASFDASLDALVRFARTAADQRGHVDDATWKETLEAGWRDDQLLEAFANVVRTFLTNGFNHLVGTELDVPAAPGVSEP